MLEVYWEGVEKVVEIVGSGARRRIHDIGDDVETSTNIVYSSQFNSLRQLADATNTCLVEKKLKEGVEFKIPSPRHVQLQLSPNYSNRSISASITGRLNIKRRPGKVC